MSEELKDINVKGETVSVGEVKAINLKGTEISIPSGAKTNEITLKDYPPFYIHLDKEPSKFYLLANNSSTKTYPVASIQLIGGKLICFYAYSSDYLSSIAVDYIFDATNNSITLPALKDIYGRQINYPNTAIIIYE